MKCRRNESSPPILGYHASPVQLLHGSYTTPTLREHRKYSLACSFHQPSALTHIAYFLTNIAPLLAYYHKREEGCAIPKVDGNLLHAISRACFDSSLSPALHLPRGGCEWCAAHVFSHISFRVFFFNCLFHFNLPPVPLVQRPAFQRPYSWRSFDR